MRQHENISAVAALQPDFMGFIFYEKSKRFVGNDFTIPNSFPKPTKRVGVFVNEPIESVLEKVSIHQLDFVQLHGNERAVECKKLKSKVGVIKAFPVDEHFDFAETKPFVPFVDFFLFDTKSPDYGGSGKKFDWNLMKKYQEIVPFFLSGGISKKNLSDIKAVNLPQFFAIDLNSGVEIEPALKDIEAIQSIQTKLRNI